jgi:type III restriction enzyme
MAKSIIAYDKDLPELPGRLAWERPTSFLVKDADALGGWRVDTSGRRPSPLLLVPHLRAVVDRWRADGYPGASEVTLRLFQYWFDEDHDVAGFPMPFRYRFCLREAIETLVYLVEAAKNHDAKALIESCAHIKRRDLLSHNVEFQTTMDGRRQVRRYIMEKEAEGVQDLPPDNLRRYAFKLATGSGKTWVMAMAIVWSHFHKGRVPGSDLSSNFLIVAPNVIVFQRLEKDFAGNQIFHQLPLIPPEWRGAWHQKVILRGDSAEPDPSANLFLTNIHPLYESRQQPWTPQNAIDALLGRKPVKALAQYERSMLERVKGLPDLVVLNDEAHHVHRLDRKWSQSLLGIHAALPKGLSLWLDFSATPKDENGMYFPWTVCDYPLAQAVEDRIVKAPLIVTKEDDRSQPAEDPEGVTRENVTEKYHYWIQAAVQRWRTHEKTYRKLGLKPVLFVMAEKNAYADVLGGYLRTEFGFKEAEVRIIHTDNTGEVTQKDLDAAREAVRDIDQPGNKIKAIVSVMMLREGWDVRNVSVVLGLRPFTAHAEILPEQVIGRGLRLMTGVGPDRTQTLEVLGLRNLLRFVREQLEAEGVGVGVSKSGPPPSFVIEAIHDRLPYDIAIPLTKPRLTHNVRKLGELDPSTFEPIYDQKELADPYRVSLKLEFATLETHVHSEDLVFDRPALTQELLSSVASKVVQRAKLPCAFAKLCPIVRRYLATRCFGGPVDVDSETVRSHLNRVEFRDAIANYLARQISELTVEKRTLEFENADFKLSDTRPFSWRRNLPLLEAKHTVFNAVATYNDFERAFAEFLDQAPDVLRFASLVLLCDLTLAGSCAPG